MEKNHNFSWMFIGGKVCCGKCEHEAVKKGVEVWQITPYCGWCGEKLGVEWLAATVITEYDGGTNNE